MRTSGGAALWSRWRPAVLAATSAAVPWLMPACRDATSLGGSLNPVAALQLDQEVSGDVRAGSRRAYSLVVAAPIGVSARIAATQGSVRVVVVDTVAHETLAVVTHAAGNDSATADVRLVPDRTYLVLVDGLTGSPARFRLRMGWHIGLPEHRSAAMAIGDTIVDVIDHYGDADEYWFDGVAGQQLIVSATRTSGVWPIQALVTLPGDDTPLGIMSGAGIVFDAAASPPFTLPVTGRYRLIVRRDLSVMVPADGQPGPYLAWLHLHNPGAESHPGPIALGDTVTDAIDYQHDEDIVTFTAAAGQQVRLFVASAGGAPGAIDVQMSGPGFPARTVFTIVPTDTSLLAKWSERFTLSTAGVYAIRASGTRGARYRLWLYAIRPAPETGTPTLAVGDSTRDSLPVFGDIDDYVLTVGSSTHFNVGMRLSGPNGRDARLQLMTLTGDTVLRAVELQSGFGGGDLGAFRATRFSYRLRIENDNVTRPPYLREYQVVTWPIDSAPEVASGTLTVGTAARDSLAPLGDFDVYHVALTAGRRYETILTGGPDSGTIRVQMPAAGPGDAYPDLQQFVDLSPAAEQTGRILRFAAPATRSYDVVVSGGGRRFNQSVPYRVRVSPYPAAPESAAANLVPGDSVLNERIDRLGDVDSFAISGAPGQEVVVVFTWNGTANPPLVRLMGTDTVRATFGLSTAIPASGVAGVLLLEQQPIQFGYTYGTTGRYALRTYAVNSAPEGRPSGIALGDTIQETLQTAGDIDVYSVTLAPGTTYTVWTSAPDINVSTTLVDPAGNVLLDFLSYANGATISTVSVPSPGVYRLRIASQSGQTATRDYRAGIHLP